VKPLHLAADVCCGR